MVIECLKNIDQYVQHSALDSTNPQEHWEMLNMIFFRKYSRPPASTMKLGEALPQGTAGPTPE